MIAPGEDILSEDILVGHNADGTHKANIISGTQLIVGSIAADKIYAGDLSAISAHLGTIISGTITGATMRTAASGARVLLDQLGIRQYNAGNVQTAELKNDGSGWLGSSLVFKWDNAGVIELNGSAVMPNTITGGKVNYFNVPVIDGLVITNNSPSAGYVAWNSFTLTHQGTSYTIAAGSTNKKFIYWKKATSTTVLQMSDTPPARANDQFLVIFNDGGTGIASLFSNIIYADYINAVNLAAISADLGSITAGTITGGTIRTAANVGEAGGPAGIQLNSTELAGYSGGTTKQFYLNASTGKAFAGAGTVILDVDGVGLAAGIAYPAVAAKKLRFMDGSTLVSSVTGWVSGGNPSIELAAGSTETARLSIVDEAGGQDRGYFFLDRLDAYCDLFVGNAVGPQDLTVYGDATTKGGLNVGTATGAGVGAIRIEQGNDTYSLTSTPSIFPRGITEHFVLSQSGAPGTYGLVNTHRYFGNNAAMQWFFPYLYNGTAYPAYRPYFRLGDELLNTWGSWFGVAATDASGNLGIGVTASEKIHSSAKVRADTVFNVNGVNGISVTDTDIVALQWWVNPDPPNNSVLQYKTQTRTFVGGIRTATGAASGWLDVP